MHAQGQRKGKVSRESVVGGKRGFLVGQGARRKKGVVVVGVTEKETNAEGDFLETLPLRADLDFHTSPSTILTLYCVWRSA